MMTGVVRWTTTQLFGNIPHNLGIFFKCCVCHVILFKSGPYDYHVYLRTTLFRNWIVLLTTRNVGVISTPAGLNCVLNYLQHICGAIQILWPSLFWEQSIINCNLQYNVIWLCKEHILCRVADQAMVINRWIKVHLLYKVAPLEIMIQSLLQAMK